MEKARDKVNGSRLGSFMAKDDPEREKRLADALRANLRRRKAQSREQADGDTAESRPREG